MDTCVEEEGEEEGFLTDFGTRRDDDDVIAPKGRFAPLSLTHRRELICTPRGKKKEEREGKKGASPFCKCKI